MSMTVRYKHISPWLLSLFKKQPRLVEPFVVSLPESLEPGIPVTVADRMKTMAGIPDHMKKKMEEMMGAVTGIAEDMREDIKRISPENAPKILAEAKSEGFNLGKMFEIVQFHISGEISNHGTSLLSRAVTGDEDIGNDLGYGLATFLSKEDVEKIAKSFSGISEKDFLTNYSTNKWNQDTTKHALVYFKGLASYYADAEKTGHAMLVWGA